MKIRVVLLGQARAFAAGGLVVDVPEGASVNAALPAILVAAPGVASILANPDGSLRPGVMAIVRDAALDPATAGTLAENDELSLLPPMSGG